MDHMNNKRPTSLDDEHGNCKMCGHLFDSHLVIAFDVNDLSNGGELRCPVEGGNCLRTLGFDLTV